MLCAVLKHHLFPPFLTRLATTPPDPLFSLRSQITTSQLLGWFSQKQAGSQLACLARCPCTNRNLPGAANLHCCNQIWVSRGKGRKRAWQGAWHENTTMLRMQMLPNLLPVVTYEISRDWRFEPPPYTLLTQEGLQLAVASFRDHGSSKLGSHMSFPFTPPCFD